MFRRASPPPSPLAIDCAGSGAVWTVRPRGPWTVAHAMAGQALLPPAPDSTPTAITLDLAAVDRLDTVGVLLFKGWIDTLHAQGHTVTVQGLSPAQAPLFAAVPAPLPLPTPAPTPRDWLAPVEAVGAWADGFARTALDMVAFLGSVVIALGRALGHPRQFPFTPLVFHMQAAGLSAIPILGLLSFLIGIVLAYQAAIPLKTFGADLYVVNMLGISVLRELGILITAIIIAGRSGSAFTAQIGTMKVNQEVDAMQTLGLDPLRLLVVPRILALVLTLPLLAFFANMVSLLGGALMAYVTLDIPLSAFLVQLRGAIVLSTLWVGLVKAPVFAFVIGMVGCHEGLRVTGSAESVGQQTTKSVVESIFLVIVLDAIFSIIFSLMGV